MYCIQFLFRKLYCFFVLDDNYWWSVFDAHIFSGHFWGDRFLMVKFLLVNSRWWFLCRFITVNIKNLILIAIYTMFNHILIWIIKYFLLLLNMLVARNFIILKLCLLWASLWRELSFGDREVRNISSINKMKQFWHEQPWKQSN